jgi:predicted glutamine amidotransferase
MRIENLQEFFQEAVKYYIFFAKNVYCNRFKKKMKRNYLNLSWIMLSGNALVEEFCEKFVKFYIFTWVNNVNRVLSGRDHKNLNDLIKQKAQVKYYKTKGKKCAVRKMKQLN